MLTRNHHCYTLSFGDRVAPEEMDFQTILRRFLISGQQLEVVMSEHSLRDKPSPGFGFIYKITSPDGMIYIGQTIKSVQARCKQHTYPNGCLRIYRAYNKYGSSGMSVSILGHHPLSMLDAEEIKAIKDHNCISPLGYNLCGGGECGRNPSEETRQRYREAIQKRWKSAEFRERMASPEVQANRIAELRKVICGVPRTDEVKDKLSKAFTGRVFRADTIARMSIASKGRGKGTKKSAETIERMRAAHKGKTVSEETRLRLSILRKGLKNNSVWTDEARAKMSLLHIGKVVSSETKRRLSESHKGKTMSAETRAKMSASHYKRHSENKELRSKSELAEREAKKEVVGV